MIEQKGLAVFNKAVAETITRAVCTISGKDYTDCTGVPDHL